MIAQVGHRENIPACSLRVEPVSQGWEDDDDDDDDDDEAKMAAQLRVLLPPRDQETTPKKRPRSQDQDDRVPV